VSNIIEARNLSKTFHGRGRNADVAALNDVSITVARGEIYGLVGESGSGKSTLSRILVGLEQASAGEVLVDGIPVIGKQATLAMRRRIQYVFQDPFGSLPPHMTIREIVADPLIVHRIGDSAARERSVRDIIGRVGLSVSDLDFYPGVFSGGQRQRISLARALVTRPELVICDEVVSGLDVSIQAQILNLLLDLHEQLEVSYIFVSHDLRVVRYLSDRVGVMREGELVEEGRVEDVFASPQHAYTQHLLASSPELVRPEKLLSGTTTGHAS
jgi:oligopeptide transport system ATP-binding protein